MFLYETHMHTSEVSRCGKASAREMVKGLKDHGYTGAVVTDHFLWGNTFARPELPWEERVRILMSGYTAAKQAGDEFGIQIFLGWEATTRNVHDFLTYGLDEAFLLSNPDLPDLSPEEYCARCRKAGGFVAQAHPYRKAWYIPDPGPEMASILDAVEVRNAGNVQDNQAEANDLALKFAETNRLPQMSGSDAHRPEELIYGMTFANRMNDICDLIGAIRQKKGTLI